MSFLFTKKRFTSRLTITCNYTLVYENFNSLSSPETTMTRICFGQEPEVAPAKDGAKDTKSAPAPDIEVTTIDDDDDEPR